MPKVAIVVMNASSPSSARSRSGIATAPGRFVRGRRRGALCRGVLGQFDLERAQVFVAGHRDLTTQSADDVLGPLGEVHDALRQTVRMQAGAQHVDGRLEQFGRDTVDQDRHRPVRGDELPSPVDEDRRVRLVTDEHPLDRGAHGLQLGRVEIGRVVRRRVARRDEQRVAGPQRHVEVIGEVEHHLAARTGTAGLDEAQVARRDPGIRGEIELAHPAARPPVAQQRPDLFTAHMAPSAPSRVAFGGEASTASAPMSVTVSTGARPNHYLRGNGPAASDQTVRGRTATR